MKHIRATVRFVSFVILTLVLYVIWFFGLLVIPNKVYWRQIMCTIWSRGFARIAGMKIEIVGDPPRPPFFLVSNHLGYVDIMAIRAVVTGVFVAKKEIDDWFLAGQIVRDMGNIFIDRNNRRDIPRAGEAIIRKLSEGEGVIVFPEGTSTKGEDVLPFNSSFLEFAAKTDLPVSYASISYRTPTGAPAASTTICWWEDISFVSHLYRLLQLNEFTAVITFGEEPVVNTDRKLLASQLRQRVREHFVPVI